MIFWKTKLGEELTFSQFIKRWKEGINKAVTDVTPIQRLESNLFFCQTMIIGFFLGLCVSLYNNTWWLAIILFGGLGMNIIQYKTFKQQLNMFKQIEEQIELNARIQANNIIMNEVVKALREDEKIQPKE